MQPSAIIRWYIRVEIGWQHQKRQRKALNERAQRAQTGCELALFRSEYQQTCRALTEWSEQHRPLPGSSFMRTARRAKVLCKDAQYGKAIRPPHNSLLAYVNEPQTNKALCALHTALTATTSDPTDHRAKPPQAPHSYDRCR